MKASNSQDSDSFGSSLALSANGLTLAVGAINEGSNATGINGDQKTTVQPAQALSMCTPGTPIPHGRSKPM